MVNDFISQTDVLPISAETPYPFRNCDLNTISIIAREEFINLFWECKNNFEPSVPTADSLFVARTLLGVRYTELSPFEKAVLKIKDDRHYCEGDFANYDLAWLYLDAKREYKGTEFELFCENADPLDLAVIIVDFLCRHPELVRLVEKLKSLRQKVRDTQFFGERVAVGF